MSKTRGSISKIVNREKQIESRWYRNKLSPLGKISNNDVIFFKHSGGLVVAKAEVSRFQEFYNINNYQVTKLLARYANKICLNKRQQNQILSKKPRNVILIWLKNPKNIEPVKICKKNTSQRCAWLTVNNINDVTDKNSSPRPGSLNVA